MIEEKYEDLVNRDLDGETTPEESALLRAHLSADPAARGYHEDLRSLQRLLRAVVAIEPPPTFKQDLLRMIRERGMEAQPEPARREGCREPVVLALRRRLTWGTAYTFAAGIAVGVALLVAMGERPTPSSRLDDSTLPGAMLPVERFDDLQPIDSQPLRLQGVRGRAQTKSLPYAVLADIEVAAEQPVQIRLAFDPGALVPLGFAQKQPGGGVVRLGSGEVEIEHVGENRYVLALGRRGTPAGVLVVQVRLGDSVVEQVLRAVPEAP
jgi:hypothetical protein